jgi:hypothetical protein
MSVFVKGLVEISVYYIRQPMEVLRKISGYKRR